MEGIRISNKEYREREGVSSTDLKHMVKSPAHFRYWKDNPQEDTPALLFGRAVHKYVLEKDDFFTEFAVAPNVDRRTKEGRKNGLYLKLIIKVKILYLLMILKRLRLCMMHYTVHLMLLS